ncbi:hypothetical protein B0A50_08696 [Salinomyces thailandicus]|uniref:DUF676 domain-containing protein n=1 Tax=Salinomyces thailandicus TaxID=706561 RepID=A0A4U0TJN7_9PEZI|nr:hypothetical protein B0A50_08696 [Salinomyces thailandica]
MSSFELSARASGSGDCRKDTCPASASIYGYAPDWDFNMFFTIGFGISGLIFYHQSFIWPKWRAFSLACAIGCFMESGGYVGRLLLSKDPFSDIGFKLNVILLTIAPAFISAGIYIVLKHAIVIFGRQLSRLPPTAYMYIFVACDMVSIILQGAGGSISAVAKKKSLLDQGVDIMIAGLASQVFTLMVFFVLVVEFAIRCRKNPERLNLGTMTLAKSAKFRLFFAAVTIAFLAIFARCCYRVAELCNGWGSEIMRKQSDFIVMDSDMCFLAVLALNIFHPGIFLKFKERVQVVSESEFTEMKGSMRKGRPCQACDRLEIFDTTMGHLESGRGIHPSSLIILLVLAKYITGADAMSTEIVVDSRKIARELGKFVKDDVESSLWGNPSHMLALQAALRKQHRGEDLQILITDSNAHAKTYDGIAIGGERATYEIEQCIRHLRREGMHVKQFSIIGYSMGGLIARYAIGLLYQNGFFDGVEPVNFTTFATPHLGASVTVLGEDGVGDDMKQKLQESDLETSLVVDSRIPPAPHHDRLNKAKTTTLWKKAAAYTVLAVLSPIYAPPVLAYSAYQSARSRQRIRHHHTGLSLERYRLHLHNTAKAVETHITAPKAGVQVQDQEQRTQIQCLLPIPPPTPPASLKNPSLTSLPLTETETPLGNGDHQSLLPAAARSPVVMSRLTQTREAIAHNLNALEWTKHRVTIQRSRHAHAAIIARTSKAAFAEGKEVCAHWASRFAM